MANQFNLDDKTNYDIGTPFLSVVAPGATIAHTNKGIVVSLQSGTRYTCSYSKLFNLLKVNAMNPDDVDTRDNINDILSKFKYQCEKMIVEGEKRIKEITEELNNK